MRSSSISIENRRHPKNAAVFYGALLVNGTEFREQIHRAGYEWVDCIEPIGWTTNEYQREYAERLLLRHPSALPSGRHAVLVCSLCADLSCGCISADVTIEDDKVYWRELGFEDDYSSVEPRIFRMGSICFELSEFEHALRTQVDIR